MIQEYPKVLYKNGTDKKTKVLVNNFEEVAEAFESGFWSMSQSKGDEESKIKAGLEALENARKKAKELKNVEEDSVKKAYQQGWDDCAKEYEIKDENPPEKVNELLAIPVMDKKLISAFNKAGITKLEQIPQDKAKLIEIEGIGEATAKKILDHFKE